MAEIDREQRIKFLAKLEEVFSGGVTVRMDVSTGPLRKEVIIRGEAAIKIFSGYKRLAWARGRPNAQWGERSDLYLSNAEVDALRNFEKNTDKADLVIEKLRQMRGAYLPKTNQHEERIKNKIKSMFEGKSATFDIDGEKIVLEGTDIIGVFIGTFSVDDRHALESAKEARGFTADYYITKDQIAVIRNFRNRPDQAENTLSLIEFEYNREKRKREVAPAVVKALMGKNDIPQKETLGRKIANFIIAGLAAAVAIISGYKAGSCHYKEKDEGINNPEMNSDETNQNNSGTNKNAAGKIIKDGSGEPTLDNKRDLDKEKY